MLVSWLTQIGQNQVSWYAGWLVNSNSQTGIE